VKIHCSILAEDAIKAAVMNDYKKKRLHCAMHVDNYLFTSSVICPLPLPTLPPAT
jgi:hypothetical protein